MDIKDRLLFSEEFRRINNTILSFIKKIMYGFKSNNKIVYSSSNSLYLDKNAKIKLDGKLYLSRNQRGTKDAHSILIMQKNSNLIMNGNFSFAYGADIRLFDNATLVLGKDSYINTNVLIRCMNRIEIGDNCAISYNVTIFDDDFHEIIYENKRNNTKKDVIIGDNVWVGANVTILKGVHIGNNAVIGAGSVVTKDIPANVLACGNPAKVIDKIEGWK